ncbi:MAG: phosphoribosylanthranilate isomerase [Ruminococcus sp.]|nr:phosphoribosylanthranilate isomerase [Ruminococcus sp.]
MKIKICGLFRREDALYVNEALPDYVGFVFAESHRRVTPETAAELKRLLDPRIKTVGVFVNADMNFFAEMTQRGIIDAVQLHGTENDEYARELRGRIPAEIPIIKAFSVSCGEDIANAEKFPCDFMLLDNGKGGTGQSFSWELLRKNMPERTFLAGGVNTENIAEAAGLRPYCIDVSSGAETNGIKDREKILKLVQTVRNCK